MHSGVIRLPLGSSALLRLHAAWRSPTAAHQRHMSSSSSEAPQTQGTSSSSAQQMHTPTPATPAAAATSAAQPQLPWTLPPVGAAPAGMKGVPFGLPPSGSFSLNPTPTPAASTPAAAPSSAPAASAQPATPAPRMGFSFMPPPVSGGFSVPPIGTAAPSATAAAAATAAPAGSPASAPLPMFSLSTPPGSGAPFSFSLPQTGKAAGTAGAQPSLAFPSFSKPAAQQPVGSLNTPATGAATPTPGGLPFLAQPPSATGTPTPAFGSNSFGLGSLNLGKGSDILSRMFADKQKGQGATAAKSRAASAASSSNSFANIIKETQATKAQIEIKLAAEVTDGTADERDLSAGKFERERQSTSQRVSAPTDLPSSTARHGPRQLISTDVDLEHPPAAPEYLSLQAWQEIRQRNQENTALRAYELYVEECKSKWREARQAFEQRRAKAREREAARREAERLAFEPQRRQAMLARQESLRRMSPAEREAFLLAEQREQARQMAMQGQYDEDADVMHATSESKDPIHVHRMLLQNNGSADPDDPLWNVDPSVSKWLNQPLVPGAVEENQPMHLWPFQLRLMALSELRSFLHAVQHIQMQRDEELHVLAKGGQERGLTQADASARVRAIMHARKADTETLDRLEQRLGLLTDSIGESERILETAEAAGTTGEPATQLAPQDQAAMRVLRTEKEMLETQHHLSPSAWWAGMDIDIQNSIAQEALEQEKARAEMEEALRKQEEEEAERSRAEQAELETADDAPKSKDRLRIRSRAAASEARRRGALKGASAEEDSDYLNASHRVSRVEPMDEFDIEFDEIEEAEEEDESAFLLDFEELTSVEDEYYQSDLIGPRNALPAAREQFAKQAELYHDEDDLDYDGYDGYDGDDGAPRRSLASSSGGASPAAAAWTPPKQTLDAVSKESQGVYKSRNKNRKEQPEVEVFTVQTLVSLSDAMSVPLADVAKKLKELDHDAQTAQGLIKEDMARLIIEEFGYTPVKQQVIQPQEVASLRRKAVKTEEYLSMPVRAPVICVMGHVDHGKTTLLDRLRSENRAEKEAGGITQAIGAFRVDLVDKPADALEPVQDNGAAATFATFLDTPGHAAFKNMRAKGASSSCTDLIILVISAVDGLMPQTLEVIQLARKANLPLIVAINKCDVAGADPAAIQKALFVHDVVVEDMGGEVLCCNISAKTGEGIQQLKELISVTAEVLQLHADRDCPAEAYVMESRVHKGGGNVATVLVRNGSLRVGQYFVCGLQYGRIRALHDERDRPINRSVNPGEACQLFGLKSLEDLTEDLYVVESEDLALRILAERQTLLAVDEGELLSSIQSAQQYDQKAQAYKIQVTRRRKRVAIRPLTEEELSAQSVADSAVPIIVKADVSGSLEVLLDYFAKLPREEVVSSIVKASLGEITEADVRLAGDLDGARATLVAFNVKVSAEAALLAKQMSIRIISHQVIYSLWDDIRDMMSERLPAEMEESSQGHAEVLQLFPLTDSKEKKKKAKLKAAPAAPSLVPTAETPEAAAAAALAAAEMEAPPVVAGVRVKHGKLDAKMMFKLKRDEEVIIEQAPCVSLRVGRDAKPTVEKGSECGIRLGAHFDSAVRIGDVVECFTLVKKKKVLDDSAARGFFEDSTGGNINQAAASYE